MEFVKDGASSCVTTGFMSHMDSADYFYVKGSQITPFAIPGDLGALVLNKATGSVVGLVSMMETRKENVYVT